MKEISQGDFSFAFEVARFYIDELEDEVKIKDIFDVCFKDLSKKYRAEYFFKNIVAEKLLLGKHSLNTATIIPEFRVGSSKADCVMINGSSTCYEIKSSYDNLDRLPEQIKQYKSIFDKVCVITSNAHLKKVLNLMPLDIGIIELTGRNTLRTHREPKVLDHEINVSVLMRSLRASEYKEIVRELYGFVPDVKNTDIYIECEKLLEVCSPDQVRKTFCDVLKVSRKVKKDFVTKLPKSLLMAGISYSLNSLQQENLLDNLSKKISKEFLCTTQSFEESNSSS
ncbi:sce7726 family protein [Kushneria sp. Sum13]|uniref:sce7726 family protein n=1 Tax=Kushneria sp. Sum13 TaxID=3459196 RepID=UPI0040451F16